MLAQSFARAFFRNAINNGLIPIEIDTSGILEGHRLIVSSGDAGITVTDVSTGRRRVMAPLPGIMRDILSAGGLVPYVRAHGRFVRS